ncbi:MAG: aminoacyl-tRNA hydrolase [Alphaproteobacteria bacterium]|nr:MAG: aminoacyl-tRNA hydrolase [Alphaproteobacteria bacterium]
MWILAGLGNPGPQYAAHRHNIGARVVDALAHAQGFDSPRMRFSALVRSGRIADARVMALLPRTYMNESGRAVGAALRFYKLPPERLVVFHDELDLAFGKLRIKRGGGAAGHNGLRSIMAAIGPDFWRVRLGIGHPGDKERVRGYVLSNFTAAEEDFIEKVWLPAILRAMPLFFTQGPERVMSEVARLAPPPRPPREEGGGRSP